VYVPSSIKFQQGAQELFCFENLLSLYTQDLVLLDSKFDVVILVKLFLLRLILVLWMVMKLYHSSFWSWLANVKIEIVEIYSMLPRFFFSMEVKHFSLHASVLW